MEFRGNKLIERVLSILDATGLDPRYLELELTESVLMKHAESAGSMLNQLRSKGVRLAIDDFGTGYSSLSYLKKFPMDSLKIDQSFVRQVKTSPDDTALLTAVIGIGRSFNLRIIAEGIESQQELTFLQENHCDEAQGFYLSRPLPSVQFAQLLAAGVVPGNFRHVVSQGGIVALI